MLCSLINPFISPKSQGKSMVKHNAFLIIFKWFPYVRNAHSSESPPLTLYLI